MSFAEGYLMGLQIKERRAQESLRQKEFEKEQKFRERELSSREQEVTLGRQDAYTQWAINSLTPKVTADGEVIPPAPGLREAVIQAGKMRGFSTDFLESTTGGPEGQKAAPSTSFGQSGPVTQIGAPVDFGETEKSLQPFLVSPGDKEYVAQKLKNIQGIPNPKSQRAAVDALMKEMRDKQIQEGEQKENRDLRQQMHQETVSAQRQIHEENMTLRRELKGELTGEQKEKLTEQIAALDNSLDIADRVKSNLGVLNSMISAGKIKMATSPTTGDLIVSRTYDLTPQEAQLAADFQSLSEHINTIRGPLGATGFRGEEAFAALQAQRGQLLAHPEITQRVLDTTIKSMTAIRNAKKKYLPKDEDEETASPKSSTGNSKADIALKKFKEIDATGSNP